MSGYVTMHLDPLQQCSNVMISWRICGAVLLFVLSCNPIAKADESHPHLQSLGKVYRFGVVDNFLNGRSRHLQSLSDSEQVRAGAGAPAERLGLLGSDGSICEAHLMRMDLATEGLNLPMIERLEVESSNLAASNATLMSEEEVMRPFVACKENMRDAIPSRQEEMMGTDDDSCVVMVPPHYVRQYKWPHSQLKARLQNVPNVPLLQSRQAKAWVYVNASAIFFLPGGPMYPHGVEAYLDRLVQLVPDLRLGEMTRVVLDVGGGSGSLSHALAQRGVITLCVAPYESPENAVQLVMERGYPALLTRSFSSHTRLPFPSQAFDLLHCASCNIPWSIHDGANFVEADRILRNGGYFVWTMDASKRKLTWPEMEMQAGKMCWKLVAKEHQIVVWRKPTNRSATDCGHATHVPLCPPVPGADAAWKVAMKPCLANTDKGALMAVANWTSRLINPPTRLQSALAAGLQTAKNEAFLADFNYWDYLTDFYLRFFGPLRTVETRNVLDANAGYGGFAAALALKTPPVPWWVLNVVPVDEPNCLPVIFDRGLLGIYHDWCEVLDAYPRTFDLVHVSGFFSAKHRCSMRVILQEIDRLLRPGGFALFRDHKHMIVQVKKIVEALQWKTHVEDTESGPMGTDKLLHCQKTKWTKKQKI